MPVSYTYKHLKNKRKSQRKLRKTSDLSVYMTKA